MSHKQPTFYKSAFWAKNEPLGIAQQDKFNKRVQEESADYISTTLKGRLASVFDGECRVDADDDDGHIIWIEYPHDGSDSYILPRVKLESDASGAGLRPRHKTEMPQCVS